MTRLGLLTCVAAALVPACSMPAAAQDAREAQIVGFHTLCNQGDRKACVKFGMMLQQNTDRNAQWRRVHPEFFFFEH